MLVIKDFLRFYIDVLSGTEGVYVLEIEQMYSEFKLRLLFCSPWIPRGIRWGTIFQGIPVDTTDRVKIEI